MYSALSERPVPPEQLVFRSQAVTPIRPEAISHMWKKCNKWPTSPIAVSTCLRHTHATLLLANGIPIIEVSLRLGHANVTQTLDTYGHAMSNYDQGIANEIEKIYRA